MSSASAAAAGDREERELLNPSKGYVDLID